LLDEIHESLNRAKIDEHPETTRPKFKVCLKSEIARDQ
jgi:hypothetical protein